MTAFCNNPDGQRSIDAQDQQLNVSAPKLSVQKIAGQFQAPIKARLADLLDQDKIELYSRNISALLEAPLNTWIRISEPSQAGIPFIRGLSGNFSSSEGVVYGGVIETIRLFSGLPTTELHSAALVADLSTLDEIRKSAQGYARPVTITGSCDALVPGRTPQESSLPIGTTIKNVTAAGIFLPDHEANALTFSRHYLKLMSTYIGAGLEIDSEASGIRFYRSLNTYVRDSADSAGALPRDFSKSLLGFMHKQIEACNA